MRCPKCGTENTPDSRFCGVCGLQQTPPARLAPTAKIPDDAPLAPPTRQVAPITPVAGVSYSPPSMPPHHALAAPQQAGLSTKPGGHLAPPRTSGEQAHVRPSGNYGQVQQRPSQGFDSITPTAQHRQLTSRPSGPQPAASRPSGPQRAPIASNASMSFSAGAQGRPLGLIAIVLIVDVGLAGAGAFLLAKGMSKPKAAEKADKKTEAVPVGGAPEGVAAAPVRSAVTATPLLEPGTETGAATETAAATATEAEDAGAATTTTAARKATRTTTATTTTTPATTTTATTATSPGPLTSPGPITSPSTDVDPVPAAQPSTDSEINSLAARSKASFDRCRSDQPASGSVDIAFRVNPDGTVANAAAVANTTNDDELAACLVRIISGWRVSPFEGNAMSFVRPFTYL